MLMLQLLGLHKFLTLPKLKEERSSEDTAEYLCWTFPHHDHNLVIDPKDFFSLSFPLATTFFWEMFFELVLSIFSVSFVVSSSKEHERKILYMSW